MGLKKNGVKYFYFLIILFFLSGCGGSRRAENTETPVVIRFSRWMGSHEIKAFNSLIDRFHQTHKNIKVKTEFLPWGVYWKKVRSSLLSREAADVIALSNLKGSSFISLETFQDLSSFDGAGELFSRMISIAQKSVLYDKKLYAMPIGIGVRAMIYNKELFRQASIPLLDPIEPVTWDYFFQIAKKLTKIEDDMVVQYAANFHKMDLWDVLVIQQGGSVVDDYNKPGKVTINTPKGIAGLKMINRMIEDRVIPPYSEEWSGLWGTPDSALTTGKVAVIQVGSLGLSLVKKEGIEYGTAPLPFQGKRASRGYINSLAISRDCKNTEAAWTFIRWMASMEGQQEFAKTGDFPSNIDAFDRLREENRDNHDMIPYYEELDYVFTSPVFIDDLFDSMLEDILSQFFKGQISPEEAASRIEREGNEVLTLMM